MTTITFKHLTKFAEDVLRIGEHQIEKFNERFAKDPAYAFEWSADAFEAAAKVYVGKTLQAWLSNKEALAKEGEQGMADNIMHEVNRMVVRAARWPERSTSVQSNEMKRCIAAVWAELVAKQQGW